MAPGGTTSSCTRLGGSAHASRFLLETLRETELLVEQAILEVARAALDNGLTAEGMRDWTGRPPAILLADVQEYEQGLRQ